jgi:enoyl-CoA hydratase/carnithine racemase
VNADVVLVDRQGPVVTLTLNRRDTGNANSTPDVVAAIEAAIAQINADPSVNAAILTGAGRIFSAGGEFSLMESFHAMAPIDVRNYYRHAGIQRLTRALSGLEVPIIAAINGPAFGSGFGMALQCDLRIAADTATFAMNFSTLGLLPGDGGALFLTRAVGPQAAAEIFYTGDTITAERALALGIVGKVTRPESLVAEAHALAQRIANRPGGALRLLKKLLQETNGASFSAFLDLTASMQALCHNTAEHREALSGLRQALGARVRTRGMNGPEERK